MVRKFFWAAVFVGFLAGLLTAALQGQTRTYSELEKEQLIRIVEPAIYPLQRMRVEFNTIGIDDWQVLAKSCGAGNSLPILTDMGVAMITCKGSRSVSANLYRLIDPEVDWANMTIHVTAHGFRTGGPICSPSTREEKQGEVLHVCNSGKLNSELAVKPSVRANFIITTTVRRYDEREAREYNNNNAPKIVMAGDIRYKDIRVSAPQYEFLLP